MSEAPRIVAPAFPYGTFRLEDGTKVTPPEGWALLEPGDAAHTRRVKEAGPSWTVQTRRGRRTLSLGVWAPAETIEAARAELAVERAAPEYQRRLDQGRARRAKAQEAYVEDFRGAVLAFLGFPALHSELSERLADAVTGHATPVGSGTVARTQRIPVEQRAEAAVIAWLRHQTTAYDHLSIARVRGKRREVRAALAKESRRLLGRYRRGEAVDPAGCPLQRALSTSG